ncbi:MAG: class II glutamine amidotransferase [Rhodospirillales bacterium]|nr:class II glutamine amidotransferase [Rhodospirillales bacterium]MDE2198601.1 class II glutamine amidotransferase [Rhodospirillales bacterium]MDE2577101.1 class II glutamine amidotransferase [Rhodospirillales bacterium]
MCRFLAYRGQPILLEELVAAPAHSLIHQSLHAEEAKTGTNGDGFGIGWYGERTEPGLYREVRPAWADENLRSICAQVRSGLFFAHVRASTGTATSRANCHPFAAGRFMFMHNGQIGGWKQLRRPIEAMIPDSMYDCRQGSTDSEAILLAAMAAGLARDPIGVMAATLARIQAMMRDAGIAEALRFTAALTDGERLWAYRWASDARPPTLYWREDETGLVVVSEPIDGHREDWRAVPVGGCLTALPGEEVAVGCLDTAMREAA